MQDRDRELAFRDYRLTTAEILYRLPDHPDLLQTYIWQDYDLAPRWPVLNRFLAFWQKHLDGKLYKVRVATAEPLRLPAWRSPGLFFSIQ